MEELFIAAFGLSVIVAAQPGVIGFEAIRRGLARGWLAALHLEFGSLVGDATWALVALTGASLIFQSQWLTVAMSLFGSFLLLRFAWDALKAVRNPVTVSELSAPTHHVANSDFAAGAMLSLSNPQNLTAWMGMSGIIISMGFLNPQPSHIAIFFAGFMSAQVMWCFLMAALIGLGRTLLNPNIARGINVVAAITQAYFGVSLLVQTVGMVQALLQAV